MDTPRRAKMHAIIAALALTMPLPAASAANPDTTQPEASPMNHRATGPFDVKLIPQQADNPQAQAAGIDRMALDKRFHGALEATSAGEMIAFRTARPDSAGYVALERVDGRLDGRKGTFVLQHSSTMARGVPTQSITVVPDSGTGELAGLRGSMTIEIGAGGAHAYVFDYAID